MASSCQLDSDRTNSRQHYFTEHAKRRYYCFHSSWLLPKMALFGSCRLGTAVTGLRISKYSSCLKNHMMNLVSFMALRDVRSVRCSGNDLNWVVTSTQIAANVSAMLPFPPRWRRRLLSFLQLISVNNYFRPSFTFPSYFFPESVIVCRAIWTAGATCFWPYCDRVI